MQSSQPSHSSLLLPNGKINIFQLENEIIQDISNDVLYHAQDEMKKRAVKTSKDYDEFKNFVACSQLRPVQSSQMGQLFVQRGTGVGVRGNAGVTSSSSSAYSRSSNKMCTIHQQNDKRIAILMKDIHTDNRKEGNTHLDKSTSITTTTDEILKLNQLKLNNKATSKTSSIKEDKKSNKNMNSISTKKKYSNDKESCRRSIRSIPKNNVPKNAMELEREWKLYCHASVDVLNYITLSKEANGLDVNLQDAMKKNMTNIIATESEISTSSSMTLQIPSYLRIEPEIIPKSICKFEINLTILDGIIKALDLLLSRILCDGQDCGDNDNSNRSNDMAIISFVNRWMVAMSQSGRFSLSVEFLDDSQKQCIASVLNSLEVGIGKYLSMKPKDEKALELQRGIGPLRSLYKVV